MECFLTFWSVIINLLLKIVRKKKRSPELKFVVRYRSVNAENFLLPLCRLRVQSPGNGDLGALFHKREKYLEALGFQCVLSATHFTIAEKVQYNSSLPRPSHGWVRVSEGSEKRYFTPSPLIAGHLTPNALSCQQGDTKKSRNKQLKKHFINISWPHAACGQVSFVNNRSCLHMDAAELHNAEWLFVTFFPVAL